MSAALTSGLRQRIAMMFRPDEIELAASLLADGCGPKLTRYPDLLERIRCAVLKLSRGDLNELRRAIKLAQHDWRDALVAAGFADSIKAHESWWPGWFAAAAQLAGTISARIPARNPNSRDGPGGAQTK